MHVERDGEGQDMEEVWDKRGGGESGTLLFHADLKYDKVWGDFRVDFQAGAAILTKNKTYLSRDIVGFHND